MSAGVNGIKLEEKDEVVGMEILPAEGEIFLLSSDGKAKRIEEKEFPRQGRYGKGVIAWDMPEKVLLVAVATGKPNHVVTIHMSKGAAKSARLDAAGVRKRGAGRGDAVVEVAQGESVTGLAVGWSVERFRGEEKPAAGKKLGKKAAAKPKKKPKKISVKKKAGKRKKK